MRARGEGEVGLGAWAGAWAWVWAWAWAWVWAWYEHGFHHLRTTTHYRALTTCTYHLPCGQGVARVGIENDHRVQVHARDQEGLGS